MSGIPKEAQNRLVKLGVGFVSPARRPSRLGYLLLSLTVVVLAALVARAGEPASRLAAVVLVVLPAAALWPIWRRRRREQREPALLALRAVHAVDPHSAERLQRALGLVERLASVPSGESPELASLHLSQVLNGVSLESVAKKAQARARQRTWLSSFLLLGLATLLVTSGLSIWEGLNILLAQRGVAPFPAAYMAGMDITVQPPPYVGGGPTRLSSFESGVVLPEGTEVRYEVVPRVSGRIFVLTDGLREEPFVSDGHGRLVARLRLSSPASLRVAATFGEVRIFERESLQVQTVEDRAPRVFLKGGAREVALVGLSRLELEYVAHDDYGLAAVELVLRSGFREERIELVRLEAEQNSYRGGYALAPDHPLLASAFLPVEVWVEARDHNTLSGPGRGNSEVVTLLPRPLGSVLGSRHRALREFRSRLVGVLAGSGALAPPGALGKAVGESGLSELQQALATLDGELSDSGEPPRGSLQFLKAQLDALGGNPPSARIEAVLLGTDVLMGQLAQHDAKTVAGALAAGIDELATLLREEGTAHPALHSLLAAVRAGAVELGDVGELGLDLGSVAQADLGRIADLIAGKERERARAAALHLASRLRRGTPSFGSKGAGVESGSPSSGGGGEGEGPPSTAPSDYDQLAKEGDKLAQEHARDVSELEQLLDEASRAAAKDGTRDSRASEAAQQLRDALARLPSVARFPETADAEAAQARSFGEAMADALEAGQLADAGENGAAALESLRRAEALLRGMSGVVDVQDIGRARAAVEAAARQVREQNSPKSASRETREQLRERAARERALADRARELSRKGQTGEARLPEESLRGLERAGRLMDDAARAMEQGKPDEARQRAHDAQRELERAQPESRHADEGASARDSAESDGSSGDGAEVPGAAGDRARDFRQRVEQGLGRDAGRFGPSVRRYAEELK